MLFREMIAALNAVPQHKTSPQCPEAVLCVEEGRNCMRPVTGEQGQQAWFGLALPLSLRELLGAKALEHCT